MSENKIIKKVTTDNWYRGICSFCFYEFDEGETVYIDDMNEYVCKDCKEDNFSR